ncbi:permease [Patescibacteria group bacterium]|nr:permease [Patescibacteria group bacterium]
MDVFKPIRLFSDLITYGWLGIGNNTYSGNTINFFIYDTIKIGLLLIVINYIMAITRYYFPMEKIRDLLNKRRWFGLDYLLAALLGVVTPFCSCSSIPLFIGFVGAGIPLGVTFAFLISSPLINESSLYLFPAMFGMKVTVLYNVIGIIISILGGILIQKFHMEKYVKPELLKFKSRREIESENNGTSLSFSKLVHYWWQDGIRITKNVFPYVVLGVGIGALIHGFVPAGPVEKYLSVKTWWTIPLAALLGAPLYANSVSVIPVMEALIDKGVPLGTALSFMTAIVTVSIPESMILKKVMSWQLLVMFLSITIVGIMIMGYIFNFVTLSPSAKSCLSGKPFRPAAFHQMPPPLKIFYSYIPFPRRVTA